MGRAKNALMIDYEKLIRLVDESPYTKQDLSIILGKHKGWMSDSTRKKSNVGEQDLERLASILRIDPEELLLIEEPVEEEKPISNTPTCESGKQMPEEVITRLATLDGKVDELLAEVGKIYEFLAVLSADTKKTVTGYDFTKLPRNQRAKIILEGLVAEGYGKCLYSTFITDLTKNNIGSSYAEQAMKECGYQKGTVGYGKSVTTYIIDPHWEDPKVRKETK